MKIRINGSFPIEVTYLLEVPIWGNDASVGGGYVNLEDAIAELKALDTPAKKVIKHCETISLPNGFVARRETIVWEGCSYYYQGK